MSSVRRPGLNGVSSPQRTSEEVPEASPQPAPGSTFQPTLPGRGAAVLPEYAFISSAEFPQLYGGPRSTFYRAVSVPLADLEAPGRCFTLDQGPHNTLSSDSWRAAALRLLRAVGPEGFLRHQFDQGREQSEAERVALAATEDLWQVLGDGYGENVLGRGQPTLRILLAIEPDPRTTPVVRSPVPPLTGALEACLFGLTGALSLQFFLVTEGEFYTVHDFGALQTCARQWDEAARVTELRTDVFILEQLPALVAQGVLSPQPVLSTVAQVSRCALGLEEVLRAWPGAGGKGSAHNSTTEWETWLQKRLAKTDRCVRACAEVTPPAPALSAALQQLAARLTSRMTLHAHQPATPVVEAMQRVASRAMELDRLLRPPS